MSFTQDELQAFNTILEQRLAAHRREVERSLDRRFNTLRHEFEQHLTTLNQELSRAIPRYLNMQQKQMQESLDLVVSSMQERSSQVQAHNLKQREEQQQVQFQRTMENALAAQLLAIEELIKQHIPASDPSFQEFDTSELGLEAAYNSIEVQTEIPWDDLASVVDKVLEQRLATLNDAIQAMLIDAQNYLAVQMQSLHADLVRNQPAFTSSMTNIQEIFASIQQLEHIIESMQVAMNANHALLSNRIYHHQQLPLERAHSNNRAPRPSQFATPGKKQPFPLLAEHEEMTEESAEQAEE